MNKIKRKEAIWQSVHILHGLHKNNTKYKHVKTI